MWTFDYRTFWNPGIDTIKVWYGDVIVGELHNEAAAHELQSRLQGASIGTGEGNPPPASVPLPPVLALGEADVPDPAAASAPAPPVAPLGATAPAPAGEYTAPTPAPAVDPPGPPADTPELLRITCAGPLHNAICEVIAYGRDSVRVRVVSDGAYKGEETSLLPDQCVQHRAQLG